MNIINLTGRDITMVDDAGKPIISYPSSGHARCTTEKVKTRTVDRVPIMRVKHSKVLGLTDPSDEKGTLYIVDDEVADAVRDLRMDLLIAQEPTQGNNYYRYLVNI